MFYLSKPNNMEDIEKKEIVEDENLNHETETEVWEESQEPTEPKTYSEEEVEAMKKELQSNSEKGVQKVIWEKKLYEKAYQELPKISNDDTRLVEISEEDPALAKKILEDHFDWMTIQEYKDSIDYKEDYSDPKKMEAKIQREAEKIARKKEVESEKKAFIKKLQMEWEELENFETELSDLLELKRYRNSDINKVFEKAYKLSADDESIKKLKNQEVIAKSMTSTKWGTAKTKWTTKTQEAKEIADFIKKFNL